MTTNPPLLPCPFCGGEVVMHSPISGPGDTVWSRIGCRCNVNAILFLPKNREEMTKYWNTRPAETFGIQGARDVPSKRHIKILNFCIDRLVNVYGESEGTDFILGAREALKLFKKEGE